MNASRTTAIVVGVNLIAVWVAAAAGGLGAQPAPAAVPAAMTTDQAVEAASSLLTAATGRLEAHARLRDTPAPGVARDPFRFGETVGHPSHHAPVLREGGGPVEPVRAEAATRAPAFDGVLQGMAESQDGDSVVRTAILKAGGELVLATVGMTIAGRFQVVAIAADSVEIEDLVAHTRLTCRMK
jgi:hypothetical protein